MTTIPMNFLRIEDLLDFRIKPKSANTHFVKKLTIDDLFECIENNPDQRFELINGQIIAMSNASVWHNRIINNVGLLVGMYFLQQNSPCHFYSEVSCKIDQTTTVQPDFAVMCEPPTDSRYIEKPIIIGEVFSSNRDNDARKLALYQSLNSVQEILYIEQNKQQITVYQRDKNQASNWKNTIYYQGDSINLISIGLTLTVDNIYKDIKFK